MRHIHYSLALCCVTLLLNACTGNPPIQEMSDARQALQAARQVHGEYYSPFYFHEAEYFLAQAEDELARGAHNHARSSAESAKRSALRAHTLGHTIAEARLRIQQVKQLGQDISLSEQFLERAEEAIKNKDAQRALQLAQAAYQQAETQLNETQAHNARELLQQFRKHVTELTKEQQSMIRDIEQALRYQQGIKALELAQRLVGK